MEDNKNKDRLSIHFDGKNWVFFKPSLIRLLKLRKVYHIVEGTTLTLGQEDSDLQAQYLITLNVASNILHEINNLPKAHDMWSHLLDKYEKKDLAEEQLFRQRIHSYRQGQQTITQYFAQLDQLRLELVARGGTITDSELSFYALAGLDKKYTTLIEILQTQKLTRLDLIQSELERKEATLKIFEPEKDTNINRAAAATQNFKRKLPFNKASLAQKRIKKDTPSTKCPVCDRGYHWSNECFYNPKSKFYKPELKLQMNKPKAERATPTVERACKIQAVESSSLCCTWLIDSGASRHFCKDRNAFTAYEAFQADTQNTVEIANGNHMTPSGRGTIKLKINKDQNLILQDVWHFPGLGSNLFSTTKCEEAGFTLTFKSQTLTIIHPEDKFEIKAQKVDGLYWLKGVPIIEESARKVSENTDLWHRRLGHPGLDVLRKLNKATSDDPLNCKDCIISNQTRTSFPTSPHRAKDKLELVHTDIVGPLNQASLGGFRYLITFLDDMSRHSWVYPLQGKSGEEVLTTLKNWKILVEKQSGNFIKTLHSDNGGEYQNHELQSFLEKEGIIHIRTMAYSPQQNGRAERLNRTLLNKVRAILTASKLPLSFWVEALREANTLRNHLPTKSLERDLAPREIWSGRNINIAQFRVFGCKAYAHIHKIQRREGKLSARGIECINLGIAEEQKGWKLMVLETGNIIYSRDVIFDESEFPSIDPVSIGYSGSYDYSSFLQGPSRNLQEFREVQENPGATIQPDVLDDDIGNSTLNDYSNFEETDLTTDQENTTETTTQEEPLDIVESEIEDELAIRPQKHQRHHESAMMMEQAFLVDTTAPISYKEALEREDSSSWVEAIGSEMESLKRNNTFKLAILPKGRKAVGSKWVFKLKMNPNGTINKYKARLVAKGFSQVNGIDYEETFAPVAKFNTIRMLIGLAAKNNWKLHHLDIKTAFLNGELKEEVYFKLPENPDDQVYKLHKSLYGLKQAPRVWYETLDKALEKLGYKHLVSDHSVYVGNNQILAIYVDDILVLQKSEGGIQALTQHLSEFFELEYLGEATFFLGMEIIQGPNGIFLHQNKYIKDMLKRYGMAEAKSVSTPLQPSDILDGKEETFCCEENHNLYRQIVGSLMYCMQATRPDISHAVGILSRYFDKPTERQLIGAKRVLRYLQGTSSLGLFFGSKSNCRIDGYADASYAEATDAKSTSGYVFVIGDTPISWCSKKQTTVATSTQEAEYLALGHASKEALWLRSLQKEFGVESIEPTIIFDDNQGAIALTKNPQYHARAKHYNVNHHFIREHIKNGELKIEYIPTRLQKADIFTKQLGKVVFEEHKAQLHLRCSNKLGGSVE